MEETTGILFHIDLGSQYISKLINIRSTEENGGDRSFWTRGYYVATVGNVNEVYYIIKEQEENGRKEYSLL